MSNPNDSITAPGVDLRFPTLAVLRATHSDLLRRQRECSDSSTFQDEVVAFIRRGQATGALLDAVDDRWTCQSLLDYWSATLYRAGIQPPDAVLAEFDPLLAPDLEDALCPYLGLDAFQEANQSLFFGRKGILDFLVKRLKDHRFLAVVGPSGSGKSSLVLAGLVPALKAGVLGETESWRYCRPMVPGSDPLANLARLMQSLDAETAEWIQRETENFRQDPEHLARLVAASREVPVILVVDQFEEVFTLCDDVHVRQAFVNNLLHLAGTPDTRHIVILTMRSDFETYIRVHAQ